MAEYKELRLVDKIKYHYRVWQAEKAEDKRQEIEHDDRIPVNKQEIINMLLEERAKKENKKNNVKYLSASKEKTFQNLPNTLEQYKVPRDSIKSATEIILTEKEKRLDKMLGKELNSERDAYDNIVELQTFLSHPHDSISNVENRINEKLFYIQNIFGKDILNKGLQIYENDKFLKTIYTTMTIPDRMKMQEEIVSNPKLSEQLEQARYNPENLKQSTGKFVLYQAVFSKLTKL